DPSVPTSFSIEQADEVNSVLNDLQRVIRSLDIPETQRASLQSHFEVTRLQFRWTHANPNDAALSEVRKSVDRIRANLQSNSYDHKQSIPMASLLVAILPRPPSEPDLAFWDQTKVDHRRAIEAVQSNDQRGPIRESLANRLIDFNAFLATDIRQPTSGENQLLQLGNQFRELWQQLGGFEKAAQMPATKIVKLRFALGRLAWLAADVVTSLTHFTQASEDSRRLKNVPANQRSVAAKDLIKWVITQSGIADNQIDRRRYVGTNVSLGDALTLSSRLAPSDDPVQTQIQKERFLWHVSHGQLDTAEQLWDEMRLVASAQTPQLAASIFELALSRYRSESAKEVRATWASALLGSAAAMSTAVSKPDVSSVGGESDGPSSPESDGPSFASFQTDVLEPSRIALVDQIDPQFQPPRLHRNVLPLHAVSLAHLVMPGMIERTTSQSETSYVDKLQELENVAALIMSQESVRSTTPIYCDRFDAAIMAFEARRQHQIDALTPQSMSDYLDSIAAYQIQRTGRESESDLAKLALLEASLFEERGHLAQSDKIRSENYKLAKLQYDAAVSGDRLPSDLAGAAHAGLARLLLRAASMQSDAEFQSKLIGKAMDEIKISLEESPRWFQDRPDRLRTAADALLMQLSLD
ncbi:MAG: hypothetical protein AAF745_19205, partial [Planctomycetota bacterium]